MTFVIDISLDIIKFNKNILKNYSFTSCFNTNSLESIDLSKLMFFKEVRMYDIKNNKDARYLLVKDTITKDNIYLYCEFLEKEDIKTSFQSCENCLYRHKKVYKDYDTIKCELDNFSNLDLKNQIGDKFCNKWEYKK